MAKHLLAELGPITSAIPVLSACWALLEPLPTSVPYSAAGSMVVLMVVILCVLSMGSHFSRRTFSVAFCIRLVVVLAAFLLSRLTCAPRSLKCVTTCSLVPLSSHVICLSFALVVGHVDARKHFLSATLAPMSWKYALESCMPVAAVFAWLSRLAGMNRSSASTLGVRWFALMWRIHGLIRRAMSVMEYGHPWGMEHLWVCGCPRVLPTWLYTTKCCWYASYVRMMSAYLPFLPIRRRVVLRSGRSICKRQYWRL